MLKKALALTTLALALTACGGDKADSAAPASDSGKNAVAERQALMKDWRAATDILKGMSDNPASFDAAVVKEQAQFLADSSAQMWTHYADQNAKGKAKDEVWSDPAAFKAATDKFNAAAAALNTAAQTAAAITDIEPAMGQVGESCGGCHKAFKN